MVRVATVGADTALVLGEDVAVEPQAVGRIVQVDRRQRRGIGDVEGDDEALILSGVHQLGNDGRRGVEAERV